MDASRLVRRFESTRKVRCSLDEFEFGLPACLSTDEGRAVKEAAAVRRWMAFKRIWLDRFKTVAGGN